MEMTIEVEELCKSYAHVEGVENVNISIRRGEVFGLLGANGAGKSTTIECILGTKKQDSGRVSILGMNPGKDRKKNSLRGLAFNSKKPTIRTKSGCRNFVRLLLHSTKPLWIMTSC